MRHISPSQTDREIMLEIGERLRAMRKTRRVKLQVAAERTGLSRRTVYRAEIGDNPTLETLLRLFRLYGSLGELDALLAPPEISPMDLLRATQRKSPTPTAVPASTATPRKRKPPR